jgi:hypothetical protein
MNPARPLRYLQMWAIVLVVLMASLTLATILLKLAGCSPIPLD